jgi:hypothetical protein
MLSRVHRPYDLGKHPEVQLFGAQERLRLEEGNDLLKQVAPFADHEYERRVRRSAVILDNPSTAKSLPEQIEHLSALGVLADMKLWYELEPKSRRRVSLDGDVKTAFSVDEAGQVGVKPFLLIVRTGQFVTAHTANPTPRV